jgi:large subunit ribosomal protein L13
MKKTFAPDATKIEKKWHFIDAQNKVLGRLATEIATKLMGKNKVTYAPNAEVGDKVVVINVKDIAVTGRKMQDKVYNHYTGFPGGLRTETLGKMMARKPTEALSLAVSGMLPKNKLRKIWMSNLYLYEGAEHPHKAQEIRK